MTAPRVRPATPADAAWIEALVEEEWGGPLLIADGRTFDARVLPGLIVGEREGLALYEAAGAGVLAELVLLHALALGQGLGTALVEALVALLARQGARELWLTTTNDNLEALRFYQRRGFRLMEVRPRAIEAVRLLKPGIPLVGEFGIAIRDELRLMRPLRRERAISGA